MQRIRELGLLQTLIEGREAEIEQVLRSEEAPVEKEREREHPKRVEAPAPPASLSRPSPARELRALLGSRRSLRRAMILREVLGPPVSLRSE